MTHLSHILIFFSAFNDKAMLYVFFLLWNEPLTDFTYPGEQKYWLKMHLVIFNQVIYEIFPVFVFILYLLRYLCPCCPLFCRCHFFLTLSFLSLCVGRPSWLNLCWSIPRAQRALCGTACLWQPGSSSWNWCAPGLWDSCGASITALQHASVGPLLPWPSTRSSACAALKTSVRAR